MNQAVGNVTAVLLGLGTWTALWRYLCLRWSRPGAVPRRAAEKTGDCGEAPQQTAEGAGDYGEAPRRAAEKTGDSGVVPQQTAEEPDGFTAPLRAVVFAAGLLCMVYGYCMARHWELSYINCLRNAMAGAWLLAIALVDGREQLIPHGLTLPGLGAWVVLAVLALWPGGSSPGRVLAFSLGGCLLGGGVFFLCRMLTKGGVGMGDVRVFGILGLLYGMNYTFSIMFFTILLMAVYGLGAVFARKKDMKSHVPMGPFVLAAYLLCCLLGV